MQIVFATNNAHKLSEIRAMLGSGIEVVSLQDIGCHDDIAETAETLEGNALIKARYIYERYGMSCFADDTGLEVDALGGAPGVRSARYAGGEGHDSEANMTLLLHNLEGETDRRARFRTVIALMLTPEDREQMGKAAGDEPLLFEGIVNGRIDTVRHGSEGFGYDPIFVPEGYTESFAQLGMDIKNRISHRARAVAALCDFLK